MNINVKTAGSQGKPEGSHLLILNGSSLPKAKRASLRLADNDNLSIMPPLKGG